jgi:hypothetical protein
VDEANAAAPNLQSFSDGFHGFSVSARG